MSIETYLSEKNKCNKLLHTECETFQSISISHNVGEINDVFYNFR